MSFILRYEQDRTEIKWGGFLWARGKRELLGTDVHYVTKITKNGLKVFELTEDRVEAFVFKKDEETHAVTAPVLIMLGGRFFKEEV